MRSAMKSAPYPSRVLGRGDPPAPAPGHRRPVAARGRQVQAPGHAFEVGLVVLIPCLLYPNLAQLLRLFFWQREQRTSQSIS